MRFIGLPEFYWNQLMEFVVSRPYAEVEALIADIRAYGKNIDIPDTPVDKDDNA